MTRPNVDPLPHHYKFRQNWQVIKPHLADHERVFSKPTKPKWRYDAEHEPVYMSIPEIMDKEDAFVDRATDYLDSTGASVLQPSDATLDRRTKRERKDENQRRELRQAKDKLMSEIERVELELQSLPPSRLNTGASRRSTSSRSWGMPPQTGQSRLGTGISRPPRTGMSRPPRTGSRLAPPTPLGTLGRAPYATAPRSKPRQKEKGSYYVPHVEAQTAILNATSDGTQFGTTKNRIDADPGSAPWVNTNSSKQMHPKSLSNETYLGRTQGPPED